MLTHACVLSCWSHVWLFATLWIVARQAPLCMWIPHARYWGGLPYPSPGDHPTQGLKSCLCFLPWQGVLYHWATWKAQRLTDIAFQFSSVTQSCLTLCNPTDCSMPGFPIHHQLPKLTQTHVHRVGDAIQPSHPLLSPSPPIFNLSQHWGLLQWVSSSHQVAKGLGFQLHH